MLNRIIALLLLLMVFTFVSCKEDEEEPARADERLWAAAESPDGSLYFGGLIRGYGGSGNGAWIARTDPAGSLLWRRSYWPISSDNGIFAISATADGGVAAAGSGLGSDNNADVYVLRTDADGNQVALIQIPADSMAVMPRIRATADGGFIIAGHRWPTSFVRVIRIDAEGTVIFDRTCADVAHLALLDIVESETGYELLGYYIPVPSLYWVHFDQNGVNTRQQLLEEIHGVYYSSTIASEPSGGITVAAAIDSVYPYTELRDIGVFRYEASGDLISANVYSTPEDEEPRAICAIPGQGFVIGGTVGYSESSYSDFYLVRANSLGQQSWMRNFNLGDYDYLNFVLPLANGDILTGGHCSIRSSYDAFAARFDGSGTMLWNHTYEN